MLQRNCEHKVDKFFEKFSYKKRKALPHDEKVLSSCSNAYTLVSRLFPYYFIPCHIIIQLYFLIIHSIR
jgi:hypothetical protein